MKKRFLVKVILELHAITCPGVWLCTNGFLEATIKTLGYFFKTGAMEPRFPILCHDQFIMEGYFKSVECMSELEQALGGESIEITLWQNGRRLAHFAGKLADVMRPPLPKLSCFHNVNVQILMHPSQAFPGIIAPKLEISARAIVEDRQCSREICKCSKGTSCHSVLNLAKSTLEPTSHVHNEHIEYRRQRPVCHSKAFGSQGMKPPSGNSHFTGLNQPIGQYISSSDSAFSRNDSRVQSRRLSLGSSSGTSNSFSLPTDSSAVRCSHVSTSKSSDTEHHQKSCTICLTYSNTFKPPTR